MKLNVPDWLMFLLVAALIVAVSYSVLQMRTMSDETEQRMCDEDFVSDEEGEEGDVESYLEDNSSELMDRLRELEVRKLTKCVNRNLFCIFLVIPSPPITPTKRGDKIRSVDTDRYCHSFKIDDKIFFMFSCLRFARFKGRVQHVENY